MAADMNDPLSEITLYTAPTPNGWKVSIALECLGLPYRVQPIDLLNGEQHTETFRALNPNGRIPVIVDHARDDLVLFESGAILWYLAEREDRLIPRDFKQRAECHQWLMFQMSGVGPMMGQLNVFRRYFPEKIPPAIDRYHHETERLFRVLDDHLENRDFMLNEHSIADISLWSWVYTHRWSGVELDAFSNLLRWKRALRERPEYQKGISVPVKIGRVIDTKGNDARQFAKLGQKIVTT